MPGRQAWGFEELWVGRTFRSYGSRTQTEFSYLGKDAWCAREAKRVRDKGLGTRLKRIQAMIGYDL